jgi:NADPH:quinone reductase
MKAQVATTVSPESEMLLKTIGALPRACGREVAGTIRALGDGVEGFQVAEPVVTLSATGAEGGYASVTVVDGAMTVSLDGTGIGLAAAVAAVPNAATAHAALTEVAHLKPGERVLVHGALGGLASAFPGVARTLGAASVTGTARSSSLAAARASALPYDEVIASEDLLAALGGQRFDVVIDPVGGQVRTDSLKVMAPLGRMLLVGNAGRLAAHRGDQQPLARQSRHSRIFLWLLFPGPS